MTWHPGQPVTTDRDHAEWRKWSHERKLAGQRRRRAQLRRIDYYPDAAAAAVIDSLSGPWAGRDYSSVINAIVAEWGETLDTPE